MSARVPSLLSRAAAAALVLLSVAAPRAQAPTAPQARRQDGPPVRLVLLIAVDQFRPDYLTRFGPPSAGFRTLMTRGAVFTAAYLEHGITVTAVGHSTMLTGATPSVSGIIENAWYERSTKTTVESITDRNAPIVGGDAAAGVGASPRRLLVPTLGDQMKMASDQPVGAPGAPRVIGVSLKDRSAILTAGHAADAAYFFRGGRFVTSAYYRADLPAWVQAVNARRIQDSYARKVWTFEGGARNYPTEPGPRLDAAVAASPAGNELVLAMATAALEHEQLGQRGVTDVLTVSFSSNDSVGHTYGPESPEVRDITRQTDKQVQRLLDEVERRVGLSRTLVAFTADHGVAPLPEALAARRIPGGRFPVATVTEAIEAALDGKYGAAQWIEKASLPNVYLDAAVIAQRGADATEVRRVAADAASAVPHVARVYTRDAILTGAVPRDLASERITRGYHRDRSGDLHVLLEPHWITAAAGTTHGTPYGYDAHIPLILMGPGVQAGTYRDHATLLDLAPTLAALVDVEPPAASVGRVLTEALVRPVPGRGSQVHTTSGRPSPAAATAGEP
ncbi:alkaline phosphatase family protein [Luteitalea sp. TBR-22]|uniref:alkaline phosphatase family protein n=1 Tax=Luteitalea sp. TBR-22 TaxID=2802971 RepID=UPI001AFB98EE|nr:alkaline phosphatase family protein [Luteitalea sp. TBR-22]BCS32010.1 alkaline phosphatase family protein [Luteitalea sp. TBR-22]